MKKFLMSILMCAVVLFTVTSVSAYSIAFQNWGFNPGTFDSSTSIISPIDEMTMLSLTLNNSTPESIGHGTFEAFTTLQVGAFQNDNNIILGTNINSNYQITGIMDVTGRYDYNVSTGLNELVFDSGYMNLYIDNTLNYGHDTDGFPNPIYGANDGTTIAEFNLLSGTGTMNYSLSNPDGRTDLVWGATSLASGYWFDPSGHDMSSSPYDPLILSMTDSNNTVIRNPSDIAINEFAESGLSWDTVGDGNNTKTFLSSNGSFAPAPVPESSTLILFGICLFGLSGLIKRDKNIDFK